MECANVRSVSPFMQTSVGWLLRELSKYDPQAVRDFVLEYEPVSLSRAAGV